MAASGGAIEVRAPDGVSLAVARAAPGVDSSDVATMAQIGASATPGTLAAGAGGVVPVSALLIAASDPITVTGAPGADVQLQIPDAPGPPRMIRNRTTSNVLFTVGTVSDAVPLPLARGQVKRFWSDGASVVSDDPYSYIFRCDCSLIGAAGNIDTLLSMLPDGLDVRAATIFIKETPVGGMVTFAMGFSPGGAELIAVDTPAGATGTIIGNNTDELGTLWANNTGALVTGNQPLYLRATNDAPIASGSVFVTILGTLENFKR